MTYLEGALSVVCDGLTREHRPTARAPWPGRVSASPVFITRCIRLAHPNHRTFPMGPQCDVDSPPWRTRPQRARRAQRAWRARRARRARRRLAGRCPGRIVNPGHGAA